MKKNLKRVSDSQQHHFFGFHDLPITNYENNKCLSLRRATIDRPPYPNDTADVGFIDLNTDKFKFIKKTSAFNYPQGSRQQWLGKTNIFSFNDKIRNNWGSYLVDANNEKIIQELNFPCHTINHKTNDVFYINYSRLHRVGGYGYTGVYDKTKNDDFNQNAPE